MFEALWLWWETIVLVALIGSVSLVLAAVWLIYRWHDVWRHEPPQQVEHEQAHLWTEEDPDGVAG